MKKFFLFLISFCLFTSSSANWAGRIFVEDDILSYFFWAKKNCKNIDSITDLDRKFDFLVNSIFKQSINESFRIKDEDKKFINESYKGPATHTLSINTSVGYNTEKYGSVSFINSIGIGISPFYFLVILDEKYFSYLRVFYRTGVQFDFKENLFSRVTLIFGASINPFEAFYLLNHLRVIGVLDTDFTLDFQICYMVYLNWYIAFSCGISTGFSHYNCKAKERLKIENRRYGALIKFSFGRMWSVSDVLS